MGALFDLEASGYFYSRLQNPTCDMVAAKIAAMEGGTAGMLTGSGQAANFFALFNICETGSHIVASSSIYGGTFNLLQHTLRDFGIETTFVDTHDLKSVEAAVKSNTKLIFIETLGNPHSDIPDIEAISEIAHKNKIPLVIDNTFGTPYLIRPLEHGADIVVHSATKFIGGHGTTLGGIIVDGGKFDWAASGKFPQFTEVNPSYGIPFTATGAAAYVIYVRTILLRDEGAAISPFNAFLLLQGVETLSLRLDRHVENTKKVIEFLTKHPKVTRVSHPSLPNHPDHELYKKYFPNGGGSIFTFDIKGGQEEAFKFIDSLKIFSLLANVADVKSLVIHPYTTTHAELSPEELAAAEITPATIRVSIGTEHYEDIIADLENGFAAI
jgi:O-acetylhomoserine (thiol)-lyase